MNIFTLEIWDDEGDKCTFYTVRCDEQELTETDKFFDKYAIPENDFCEYGYQLFRLLNHAIRDKYGAIDDFFDRVANLAQELPPKPKHKIEEIKTLGINFPLRLFCYRVTEKIVILFNGGIKDAQSIQDSQASMMFYEAEGYAQRIVEALNEKMIIISSDERHLLDSNSENEIIL